jgi:DUF971 family protein
VTWSRSLASDRCSTGILWRANAAVRRIAVVSSYVTGDEYLTPSRIHADRATRTLEIDWPDGHQTHYDFTTLRWLCPCAHCRGEAGIPGWLDSNPTLTPTQTELVDLNLVGRYAVAPTWADGHRTGFYTFERLREQCPCEEDSTRRSAKARSDPAVT